MDYLLIVFFLYYIEIAKNLKLDIDMYNKVQHIYYLNFFEKLNV